MSAIIRCRSCHREGPCPHTMPTTNSLLAELETLRALARSARDCLDEFEVKGGISATNLEEFEQLLLEAEELTPPVYKERRST